MDIPQNDVSLQSFKHIGSVNFSKGNALHPQREQTNDSDPDSQPHHDQGTAESTAPEVAHIKSRIKHLHNRRFILLQMQQFRKKGCERGGTPEDGVTADDSRDLCELEAIQKELEDLQVKKETQEKEGQSSMLREAQGDGRPTFRETPRGGIYMLPRLTQEDTTQRPTSAVVPVDNLAKTPDVTQCPSCQEVVLTETCSKVGEAVWILCCTSSMFGLMAGCCLIPFFVDRFKDVHHNCPKCKAHIHTYQPF